jgi:NAD-dependent dihydropyrimidine dehydrogenase PreA subunit
VDGCENALDCRACIETCPAQVFVMVPQSERTEGQHASNWIARAVLPSRCTNCGECVTACLRNAITVH